MSKLLDLLQRISDGSPALLGFGAARSQPLPGLALVGLVTADHQAGLAAAAEAGLDTAIVSGITGADDLKTVAESVDGIPWGAFVAALSEEEAQACQEGGADVLAFGLDSAAGAIGGEDDLARLVSVVPDLSDRELRAVSALPVDCFIVDMTAVSGSWTLQDLVSLGAVTRRTDKQVLVQISSVPGKKDLQALRDMGASALMVDLSAISPEELASLKAALLDMPRPRSRRRDRIRATVPSSGYTPAPAPSREDDPDEDDDYE